MPAFHEDSVNLLRLANRRGRHRECWATEQCEDEGYCGEGSLDHVRLLSRGASFDRANTSVGSHGEACVL